MSMQLPVNIAKWVEEHGKQILVPPVNNYCIQKGKDFFVMVVGGPNERTDFHINETEEWFFQLKGSMTLRIAVSKEEGKVSEFNDIIIGEGEMYLLQGNTPHNPIRYKDTIGIVIERTRSEKSIDKVRWYCEKCSHIVHEVSIQCADMQTHLPSVINEYATDSSLRTCSNCSHLNSLQNNNHN